MALMEKPLPEDVTDTDIAVPLTEDGDVEEENLNYSGAVAFVNRVFTPAKCNLPTLKSQKHLLR